MKNRDGILVKVGQVWRGIHKDYTVIALTPDDKAVVKINEDIARLAIIADMMPYDLIKSHDGADLEQGRQDGWLVWVEGVGQPAIEDCKEINLWTEDGWVWVPALHPHPSVFGRNHTYRYKLKEVDHPAKPECRLFEIDWSYCLPYFKNSSEDITVGKHMIAYRIFGFTDDPKWCAGDIYDYQPCDDKGNRKYAIGRPEK